MSTTVMLTAVLLIAVPDPGAEGPQNWAWQDVDIYNASLDRSFNANVYYPGISQGQNQPLDPALAPYSSVVFGHGFAMNRNRYDFLGRHLASHGYVVVLMNFKDLDNGNQRSDMSASITWIGEQNADPSSWLFGQLDTDHIGVSGHSMGGGVSIQVAGEDERVHGCAPLAPATEATDVARVTGPLLILAGDRDGLTPIEGIRGAYEAAVAPSGLLTIFGGNHNQFMDVSFPWEDVFDGNPDISRAEQHRLTNLYTTAHFGYYHKRIAEYRTHLYGYRVGADPGVDIDSESGEVLDVILAPVSTEVEPGESVQVAITVRNNTGSELELQGRTWVRRDGLTLIDPAAGPIQFAVPSQDTRGRPITQGVPPGTEPVTVDYGVTIEIPYRNPVEDSFPLTVTP